MNKQVEPHHEDWGGFGRPLFEDPEARALSRVGVVDIGSNSVRLVVFDGAARSPAYFFNEKIMCGLGAGMAETGRLNPEGKDRALAALHRFQALATAMELPSLSVVATAAMREAEDGASFRAQIEQETGLTVYVIDGEEEARLSAQGVLLGWPGSYGLVCDIGGSSMELAEIHEGQVGRRMTSPLGPLKLQSHPTDEDRRAFISRTMDDMARHMGAQRDRLFLVGGSWRAIAKLDMCRSGYPLHVLHEYRMDRAAVEKTAAFIDKTEADEVRREAGISDQRMSLVPFAMEVLLALLERFDPKDIAISSYGIREGLLYEQMPQPLRDRDPLIEACRFVEKKDARQPGYGKRLYNFVKPLFPRAAQARLRLVKAACLLHDVSWRAHPDYRGEVCFDNATRANLGGLKHWERVYLGLALLHRYQNRREGTPFENLYALVEDHRQHEAEVLGKAMRIGAMLWMSGDAGRGSHLEWDEDTQVLTLVLPKATAPLWGEVAEARLSSLASTLGGTYQVKMV